MFKRSEREYKVYSAPCDGGELIGTVRCAVGYRSDEEIASDDVSHLSVSAAAIVPCHRSPATGFSRGQRLIDSEGRELIVRRALKDRHHWLLKLTLSVMDGE
jgi:hypothetical protein